jgi:hypothetical protein
MDQGRERSMTFWMLLSVNCDHSRPASSSWDIRGKTEERHIFHQTQEIADYMAKKLKRQSAFCLGPKLCAASGTAQICYLTIFLFWNITYQYKDSETSVQCLKTNTFGILFPYTWHPIDAFSMNSDQSYQIPIVPPTSLFLKSLCIQWGGRDWKIREDTDRTRETRNPL